MDAYLFAGALLVVALVIRRTRPPTKAAPARVGWIIALLAAIIALAQLAHDLLTP